MTVQALAAADARITEGDHSGIINTDRLFRNLLSSQPTCFNAFGPFLSAPSRLLTWVRTIDAAADEIVGIRFEWAPDRREHFGGGTAFDAVVDYRARTGLRLLAVECKYAEDLSANDASVRDVYKAYTAESEHWQPGAESRLQQSHLWQFWLHVLLAQSITEREAAYEKATGVVMACAADHAAFNATQAVRAELVDPDVWLQWSPYEQLLDTTADVDGWRDLFQRRYLDFTPAEDLLSEDDPRRSR